MIIHYGDCEFTVPDGPLASDQFVDEAEIREAYWNVRPGEVVIDVGSYLGSYTIPALIAGATVIAVEPYEDYTEAMCDLCESNQVDMSALTIVSEALAASESGYSAEFWDEMEKPGAAAWPYLLAPREADFTTLDELVARLELARLDWVKIDVEGAELAVLHGGLETLRRFMPSLVIEDHTRIYGFVRKMGIGPQCLELLHGLGYDIEIVQYTGSTSPPRDYWIAGKP